MHLASVQSPAAVKAKPVTTFHHLSAPLHSVLLRARRGLQQPRAGLWPAPLAAPLVTAAVVREALAHL